MGIKKVKANTPGRREATFDDFADLTKFSPEKRLVIPKKRNGGRNCQGKITVRHRGGGAKRHVRLIDFKRDKFDVPAVVSAIEYDPNRGARLALLFYVDGVKTYIIAPADVKVGDKIVSSQSLVEIKPGNALQLQFIPAGVGVNCVELMPGQGAKIARGAGNVVHVMGVEGKYAQLKMPSGEIRQVKKECLCTVGAVSNSDHRHISLGKAGRSRHLGIRPTVRGTAMNPVDHPHGGGEGNQPIGLTHPKTPWGKPALGVRTRKKKRSNRLIIKRRQKRK
ncbi:50S ribosomal protein L2 [Candidatus Falkowbacteria bacterium]|uniref:Large ribosomal subunit protein uL2 n=1 Tax=Candidatus Falkowbacteria bacterium CG10_big_fil_rev_8_21_14_0_10_37_18 TaxID=1974562 RepID=A0A2H0VAY8_9BACT|nr:50S ribosomal protein L2 [Candidatus Falkowbacteria bacterium]NCQ12543.1 50S ribosomal protein L2 [Candidatus Falkowbacteria bacterium]OIO06007.1 MAG: 50S ribosomal protein L2 [Candidatus Falkowbacteria bacterium CG1_02_37_21]PIR95529.1 MAG: 50S ribosomal protein L2 [Candidatus Falkowbacteria bacterium CG10_big_fil_rev_8_21_14_0_10_37_18]